MKNFLLFGLLLFPPVLTAQTTAQIESWNDIVGGKVVPQLDAYVTHKSSEHFGSFAWFLTGQYWSEAYAGMELYPKKWMAVDMGVGLETDKNPWRIGGSVWMGSQKQSLLTVLETGGSGFWWRSIYNRKLRKNFGIGAIGQAQRGAGPRVQFDIPKTPIKVWAADFFNWNGKPTQAFGIVYNLN